LRSLRALRWSKLEDSVDEGLPPAVELSVVVLPIVPLPLVVAPVPPIVLLLVLPVPPIVPVL
jgi:hypothetical protein